MKVAIAIPCHGDTKAPFTVSLVNMVHETTRAAPDMEIITLLESSSCLPMMRTALWRKAHTWGADYLLWADADHIFPPDALLRLMRHGLAVVGVNYPRREMDARPTAAGMRVAGRREVIWTTKESAEAGAVEQVGRLGFGLMLNDLRALTALGPNAFPLFEMVSHPDGSFIGEDAFFCEKLTSAGIEIHVDHGLSWEVSHLFEFPLTNANSITQRDQMTQALRQRPGVAMP